LKTSYLTFDGTLLGSYANEIVIQGIGHTALKWFRFEKTLSPKEAYTGILGRQHDFGRQEADFLILPKSRQSRS